MYLYEGRGLLLFTLLAALQVMCLRKGFVELHKTVLGLLLSFCDDAAAVISRVIRAWLSVIMHPVLGTWICDASTNNDKM